MEQEVSNQQFSGQGLSLFDYESKAVSSQSPGADLSKTEFKSCSVRDLPESDRPRRRILENETRHLSMPELLSVLLGTGQEGLSSIELAFNLLRKLTEGDCEVMKVLRSITPEELQQVHGIGEAKAATILAAIELGKRVFQPAPPKGTVIDDPATAVAFLAQDLMWATEERFAVVILDVKHRAVAHKIISIGTPTEALAPPAEIFRAILKANGVRGIIAHNHPSGSLQPSPNDLALTAIMLESAKTIGIPILDHLILGAGNFISIRQTTSLWETYPQIE